MNRNVIKQKISHSCPFRIFGFGFSFRLCSIAEALSTYAKQSTRSCQNNRGAKLASAESGAEAVVSKKGHRQEIGHLELQKFNQEICDVFFSNEGMIRVWFYTKTLGGINNGMTSKKTTRSSIVSIAGLALRLF